MPKLKKLNLSTNKIESLATLQALESVTELVLDSNPIAKIDELKSLNKLKNLENISLTGSTIEEEGGDIRKEIIIACDGLFNLKTINGEEVTEDDITEAMALKEERIQEALAKPEGEEEAPEEDQEED
mgnify:CR=1 FL=1